MQGFGRAMQPMGPLLNEALASALAPPGVTSSQLERRTVLVTYGGGVGDGAGNTADHQCSVCLERFAQGEELRVLPCFHRFHRECVDRWLRGSQECPVCKHNVMRDASSD
mmetsp:Transcript_63051/g.159667  ORF Transcript_63051/g.159667 Transcript_63051/m.159667 type:complete len:110 (+) Transcript_63051:651-980(+)